MNEEISTSDFAAWITGLKTKIRTVRNKLAFSLNTQILELYWEIGREIAEKQENRVGATDLSNGLPLN
jgi:hypothetical protein